MDPIGESNTPSESSAYQPAPTATASKPKVSMLPIFVSIGLILSIAIVGALVYQNTRSQQPTTLLPVTPTPDPTVNWKPYRFSPTILFKLPAEVNDPAEINSKQDAQETTLPGGTTLQIWGADGASPTGGKDKFNPIKRNVVSNPIFHTTVRTVGGNEAVEFTVSTPSSELVAGGKKYRQLKGVLVKTSDGRGFVTIHYENQTLKQEVNFKSDDLIFDQILTTFKFTMLDKPPCGGEARLRCPDEYICSFDSLAPMAKGVCTKQP